MSVLSEHVEQTKQKTGSGLPTLPRVNLLPPEIGERARFRRIQYGLGGGVLAAVGLVAALFVLAAASVTDANEELTTVKTEGTALQGEKTKYAQVEAVYAQAAASEVMLTEAMGQEVRYSTFLYALGLTVPDKVWLKSVSFKQLAAPPAVGATEPGVGGVTFVGVGYQHDDVAVFLESLAKQEGYANPYFSSSVKTLIGSKSVVDFTSTVTMTPKVLSGRYTTPAGG